MPRGIPNRPKVAPEATPPQEEPSFPLQEPPVRPPVTPAPEWVPPAERLDLGNYQRVRPYSEDSIMILRVAGGRMGMAEALVFAAHIIKHADPTGERFPAILQAVREAR